MLNWCHFQVCCRSCTDEHKPITVRIFPNYTCHFQNKQFQNPTKKFMRLIFIKINIVVMYALCTEKYRNDVKKFFNHVKLYCSQYKTCRTHLKEKRPSAFCASTRLFQTTRMWNSYHSLFHHTQGGYMADISLDCVLPSKLDWKRR